jgi:beta-galactosidase
MRHRIFLIIWLAVASSAVAQTETIDLSGQWRFAMDAKDAGVSEQWYNQTLTDKINLPGILQAQGFGDDITVRHARGSRRFRATCAGTTAAIRAYTKPGKVKMPYLSQPPKHYLGVAWYQRDLDIPADSGQGKRSAISFWSEPHWETTRLDRRQTDRHQQQPGRAARFDPGELTPGSHISIRIDNRMSVPYRPGRARRLRCAGRDMERNRGKIEMSATDRRLYR